MILLKEQKLHTHPCGRSALLLPLLLLHLALGGLQEEDEVDGNSEDKEEAEPAAGSARHPTPAGAQGKQPTPRLHLGQVL